MTSVVIFTRLSWVTSLGPEILIERLAAYAVLSGQSGFGFAICNPLTHFFRSLIAQGRLASLVYALILC